MSTDKMAKARKTWREKLENPPKGLPKVVDGPPNWGRGILTRIVAETAEEDLRNERGEITLYWRVIRPDGSLHEKFPGGAEAQAAHLRGEEHIIEPGKGEKAQRVKEFEKSLQKLRL
jgi:hypothetical protein